MINSDDSWLVFEVDPWEMRSCEVRLPDALPTG